MNDENRKITNEKYKKLFNKNNKIQLMSTVDENLKFLSTNQQTKAKRARKLMQALGTPTTTDLKAMLRMNLIKIATLRRKM